MEISVRKKDLAIGLQKMVGAINPKPSLPALSFILLEAEGEKLFLTATDLELTIKTIIPCKVKRKGKLLVPGRNFINIIKELPEADIAISEDKTKKTCIAVNNIFFTLPGLKTEEFPTLPKIGKGVCLRMKEEALKTMLKRTRFSIAYDETRAFLRGLLFSFKKDSLTLVGTDTRRLAYIRKSFPSPVERDLILPIKLIDELEKCLGGEEAEVTINPNQIAFKTGETIIISQIIEGQFPKYETVFPPEEGLKKIKAKRVELINAVRRASLLTSERYNSLKFDFAPKKLTVSINSPEAGEAREQIPAEYSGEASTISFNPVYVLDVLKNLETENIIIGLTDPLKPALIQPDSAEEYKYVLMPIKVE